jgi:hypothetical protein
MKKLLPLFVAVLSLASGAKSALVLDNISGSSGLGGFEPWQAQSFLTSAGSWTLTSADLKLRGQANSIVVAIYSNSGSDLPGSSIGTLSGATTINSPTTSTILSYTGNISLLGSTRYWLVYTSNGESDWQVASSTNTTGTWSVPTPNRSAVSYNEPFAWTGQSSNFSFSLNATAAAPAAVPEPGTWAAAALLAGGAAFARWRRRKVAA